jgi:hypothetical protein
MPLMDALDDMVDMLGCKSGLHDWSAEYIGDPAGQPDRRLAWSRDRVHCRDCGQTATVILDPAPPGGFTPGDDAVQRINTAEELAQALAEGRDETSKRWVSVDMMSVRMLWLTVQHALKRIAS